jgi:D-sedoheptulose 7-phosphate isomerase
MSSLNAYVGTLERLVCTAAIVDRAGQRVDLDHAIRRMGQEMRATHDGGNKLMFVGNGGSAGICSHMAIDYSKNGGMRATAFNDGAALTCLANDLGYEQVFAKQIDLHARPGDVLIAISSSGRSANILNAADMARRRDCVIYTFSGFNPDNPLRSMGDLNIFIASHEYGFVEVGHLMLLHAVLDLQMGWNATQPAAAAE